VLISKSLQLEKTDTAKSKNKSAKAFAPRGVHFEMRRRKYIHLLNFVYEDDIKIKK
jgi:hypothetical protein